MDSWLIVFLVTIGYLAVSLAIGLMSGGTASRGTEGYVAGDRNLGFVVLYFILGASIFSAFAFLGGPGWAYSRGAASFYIIAYGTVGLLPWYFLGPRIASLGREFGYVTQAELFAHRYRSTLVSAILAIISFIAFVPYLVIQMQGAGYVFSVVTEGRIPEWGGAALAYAVVLTYVFRSGVMGVAWTNTFQGILMMALAWGLGLYLPYKLHGGVGPMFEELARTAPEMLAAPGLDATGKAWTWGGFSSSIAISVFGFGVWPHYFMKIYTARSIRTLKKMIVFYPTFPVFLVPIMFIGFSGVTAFPGVDPPDTILPTIVTSMGLPPLVVGMFCAGALAASMSSGDAIVHAAASVLVKDFYGKLRKEPLEDEKETRLIRILVIAIGALAFYFALFSSASLVFLLLLSYGFIAQLFPPLIAAFFWSRSTRPGVIAGLLTGCAVTILWNLVPTLQWQDIHPGIWGLTAHVVVLIAVSLRTPPMDRDHVRQFMSA
ncbi:MAG TPA: sodium:solute symporter family protein [Vicinamibacteria bacterium]|nr:sodium:solute symporter family protein [Vicinamibacteria bacterium]